MASRPAETILSLLAGATVLALAACGGQRPPATATQPSTATGYPPTPYPLSQVLVLELSGTPPNDTTLNVPRRATRVVILRHGPPDNLTFAEVTFPAGAFRDGGDSVRVSLHPRPGVYGLDIETAVPFDSARVTFKYAVHFSAPAEARQIFGSNFAFERALAIGRLQPDNTVIFLPSTRPASDNLSAVIPSAGSYLVGAPR
jgi:hypothetical protein